MTLRDKALKLLGDGLSQEAAASELGITRSKLRREISKTPTLSVRRFLILSDLHIPYEDKVLVNKVLAWVRTQELAGVILNGDVLDCESISSFLSLEEVPLEDEIELGNEFLDDLDAAVRVRNPGAKRVFHAGNHEARLDTYLAKNASKLKGLTDKYGDRVLSIPHLLKLRERGWEYKSYREVTRLVGELYVEHGSVVSRHSGMTAKSTQERLGGSVIVGHVHRVGEFNKVDRNGFHEAYEQGCLCVTSPSYLNEASANWSQGFAIVDVYGENDFWVSIVKVKNGKFLVDGSVW